MYGNKIIAKVEVDKFLTLLTKELKRINVELA